MQNTFQEPETQPQVNSVNQLTDISPSDWAFQAVKNMVERYQCLEGYPDQTFRGNRPVTRYEFAAALNACLDRVLEIVGGEEGITPEDFATLRALVEEFEGELAVIRGRVDDLEARTAQLEANQFSTTTKLAGETLFVLAGIATGDDADGNEIEETNTVLGYRARLNFETSFTGRDLLRARLQVSNLDVFSETATGTPEGDLFFANNSDNNFEVDALLYVFPVGESLEVAVIANAGASDDFSSTVNPFLDGDGTTGALSTFATRHPIFYLVDNAGLGLRYFLGDKIEISAGYLAADAPDPNEGNGLFNGAYGVMGQVLFKPSENFNIALTYLNSYNNETGTGSNLSNFRSFIDSELGEDMPIISNAYGLTTSWQVNDGFAIGGWVGYINTTTLSTLGGQIDRGSLDILNWAVHLSFPDLIREGDVAAILVGMEPRVLSSSLEIDGNELEDDDTSLHVEAFYQFQLNDNISITPGIIWLTAPDHNSDNEDIVIGVARMTFLF
ncbi:MAG: iron uptake porin [Coleofasciculaceae cyanobacterium SM2_3_26]|nr:iron uptake porin [Coleofasciculaceae cyanobacterium SM2_3_26]